MSSYVEADKERLAELKSYEGFMRALFGERNSATQEMNEIESRLDKVSKGEPGVAYEYLRDSYKDELAELQKQRQHEMDKKNSDQGVINDLDAEILELESTIKHLAEDTLAELLEIDLKDWASQISDSLVDAFVSGEDAAAAFDKTVADLMKSVVSKMASLYILEPMMENLRKYLFGEDGQGGAFGADYYLDEKELAGMKSYIDEIKNEALPAIELLTTSIDEAMDGMLSKTEEAEGLSAGIKGVTEETASLLASYLNATRADVSILRALHQEYLPEVKTIVSAQLTQLRAISNNTFATSMASRQIVTALMSVITTTSTGKAIRIQ